MAEGSMGPESEIVSDQGRKPINKSRELYLPQQELNAEQKRFNLPIVDTREISFPDQTESSRPAEIKEGIDKSKEKVSIFGVDNVDAGVAKNISEYLNSEDGHLLLDQVVNINGNIKLQGRFAGKLFEEVAYRWLSDQIKSGEALLSPKEVFKLWSVLYSDRKIEENTTGIRGVSVPDGLIVKEGEKYIFITTVVEYKNLGRGISNETYNRIVGQASHYGQDVFVIELKKEGNAQKMGDVLHELRPELPNKPLIVVTRGGLMLLHVIPENSKLNIRGSETIHVPITSFQINELKESLMKKPL